jgi:hypothetical protein
MLDHDVKDGGGYVMVISRSLVSISESPISQAWETSESHVSHRSDFRRIDLTGFTIYSYSVS